MIHYSKCTCERAVDAETGMCATCWTTYTIRYDIPANRRLDMRRGQEVNLSVVVRNGYVHP